MDDLRYRRLESLYKLVSSPLYQEIMDELSVSIMKEIVATSPNEAVRREQLYVEYHLVEKLRGTINAVLSPYVMSRREKIDVA